MHQIAISPVYWESVLYMKVEKVNDLIYIRDIYLGR